jgi:putative inorganic carbon (HCO3(-)) transporter
MQRFLFFLFCGILFWSPLPLGSHRVWSAALLEWLIAILFILWLLSKKTEEDSSQALRHNKVIIGLFFAIPLWSAIQLIPLPPEILTWLSPQHLHYTANTQAWQSLSLDTGATLYKLQKSIAYALFFVLALVIVNTPQRLNLVAQTIVIGGVFQAAYGVLVVLGGSTFDIFNIAAVTGKSFTSSASGTFVNRNHLAGYLEMAIALGVGLLVTQILLSKDYFAGFRASLRNVMFTMLSGKARLRVFLALMVVALVLSHSRGGNTAFFASLGICGVAGLWLYRKHHKAKSLALLFGSLIAVDVLILGSWFGLDKLAARLETTEIQHEGRTFVFQNNLELLSDFWLTGSGAGSYYSIFPNYRDNQSFYFYDFAHNDFLQIGIEYGLIGSLFFGLIVVLVLYKSHSSTKATPYCHFKRHGFCVNDGNHEYYDSL